MGVMMSLPKHGAGLSEPGFVRLKGMIGFLKKMSVRCHAEPVEAWCGREVGLSEPGFVGLKD